MKLIDALFCDDIRLEVSKKFSLMGLYTDRIVFQANNNAAIQWPARIRLAILLRFQLEEKEQHPDKFEFEYFLNNESIFTIQGEITAEKTQSHSNLSITTEGIPLELGNLGYSIKLYSNNILLITTKNMNALKITQE